MPNLDKYVGEYLGITPLAVLAFGGLFTIASLTNGGVFFAQSLSVFLYGIVSSFARQIYKDTVKHFLKTEAERVSETENKSMFSQKHKSYWRRYYIFQALLFLLLFIFFIRMGL